MPAIIRNHFRYGQEWIGGIFLGDDADPGLERGIVFAGILAEDADLPGIARREAFEDSDRGGLSGSIRAEQREDLSGRNREVDAGHRLYRPKGLGETF